MRIHCLRAARPLLILIVTLVILAGCASPAQRLNQRGAELYQQGEFAPARAAYEEALAARPDLPQTLYNLGNTEFRLQEHEVAGRTLEAAAAAAGAGLDAQAYYNLGNVRFATNDFAGAVEAYKETLRRDPTDADAKVNLELALRNLQENEEEQQPPKEPTPDPTPTPQGESTAEATPTPEGEDGGEDDQGSATSTPDATATTEPTSESTGAQSTPTVTPTPTPEGGQSPGSPEPQPADPSQPVDPSGPGDLPADLASGQLTEEQARQILEAAAGDTQSLQQALQGTFPFPDETVEKDW